MGTALSLGSGTIYIDGNPIGEFSCDHEFFVSISEDVGSIDPKFSVPFPEMEITLTAKIDEKLMDMLWYGRCKRWRLRRKAIRRRNIENRRKDYGQH